MLQLFKATVLQYSHLHQGYNAFEEKCFGKVLIGFFILISEALSFLFLSVVLQYKARWFCYLASLHWFKWGGKDNKQKRLLVGNNEFNNNSFTEIIRTLRNIWSDINVALCCRSNKLVVNLECVAFIQWLYSVLVSLRSVFYHLSTVFSVISVWDLLSSSVWKVTSLPSFFPSGFASDRRTWMAW